MVSARLVLGTLGFLQLASVCFNFWSPLIFYMLPVALLSTVILWISIYYNWKRGVEVFIFLCIVLFIMALVPFLSVLIHRQAAEKWHDVVWYCVEMLVEAACISTAVWVLYHADQKPERESLLARTRSYFRDSSASGGADDTSSSPVRESSAGSRKV